MSNQLFELQKFYCICFYLITLYFTNINSRTSTHWIYNFNKDQVIPVNNDKRANREECGNCVGNNDCNCNNNKYGDDLKGRQLMDILRRESSGLSNEPDSNLIHSGKITKVENDSVKPRITKYPTTIKHETDININSQHKAPNKNNSPVIDKSQNTISQSSGSGSLISCQPYVNQTQYDHLNGIHHRESFRFLREPEVALIFAKSSKSNLQNGGDIKINLNKIELKLMLAKSKRPKSPSVYNNIGNLLRIHGKSREAVECFRSALSLSPYHPDVLLNLARVLYGQNFLEDAVYLTRQSLETLLPSNRNPWLQHFTLGEILHSTGHLQEARHHFRNVLHLNPGFKPAEKYLESIDHITSDSFYNRILGMGASIHHAHNFVNDDGDDASNVYASTTTSTTSTTDSFNIIVNEDEAADSNGPTLVTTTYCILILIFFVTLVIYVVCVNMEYIEQDETHKVTRHFNRARAMKTINRGGGSNRLKQR